MAVTVGVVSTVLGPSTEVRGALYEAIRTFVTIFGNTHAKPLAELQREGGAPPVGLVIAAIVTLGSCLLTVLQLLGHLTSYRHPKRQRYAVRILLMVPIYAIDSFWSYLSFRDATWIAIARDTYEAYVLYNFFELLMDLLNGPDGCVALWKKNNQTTLAHSFPVNAFLPDMKLTKQLLWWWKVLIVQYVVLSPLITVASFAAGIEGVFDENSYSPEDAHLYLMVAKLVSVTLAFTALFYLYLATKVVIHEYDPTGKFISIKFVIFFSFWQYLAITTAHSYGYFPESILKAVLSWSHGASGIEDQEVALCNLLTCVEMFLTAVMHHFVFDAASLLGHGGHHHDAATDAAGREGQGSKKPSSHQQQRLSFRDAVAHAFSVSDVWATSVATSREVKQASGDLNLKSKKKQ